MSQHLSLTLGMLDSKAYDLLNRTALQAILSCATGAQDSMTPQDHPSSFLSHWSLLWLPLFSLFLSMKLGIQK